MSDFDATPVDEEASALLDDHASTDNPAVAGRLRLFASIQAAIADVEPPSPAVREGLIAAALAAAPVSNVVPLRRKPFFAAGAGLAAAAAAAALIFVVSNRDHEKQLSVATAATTAAGSQIKAADSAAASEAAGTAAAPASTAAATGTTAVPAAGSSLFAAKIADRPYNSPEELVAAYQLARDAAPPSPSTSTSLATSSPPCVFAGEALGPITYQDTPAELFAGTDSTGHVLLTALAIADCHRLIEVTVP